MEINASGVSDFMIRKAQQKEPVFQEEKPKLDSCSFKFSQEAHCVSEIDVEYEFLEIECQSSLGIDSDDGCLFVLKTEQWAINDEKDLKELFDRILSVINNKDDVKR